MIKKNLFSKKEQRLSKMIVDELGISYGRLQKLIRNKDVKVNGKRVGEDVKLVAGDDVEVYLAENVVNIIFENDDVVVAVKPRNIETVNKTCDDFLSGVERSCDTKLFAVHRLDRNTEGLVIFAKNEKSKECLDFTIKNRLIKKYYLAKVIGVLKEKSKNMVAYLKKDEKNSLVYISDEKLEGYEKIQTNYNVLKENDEFSILEVELVTGKTHQIRAHLSHIGYPILGDEKYGDSFKNNQFGKKYQCLIAYKLVLNFGSGYLSYLNGKVISLDIDSIKF